MFPLISHELSDIEQIADHLVIIQKGEVTHRVSMAEIQKGTDNVVELVTTDNTAAEKLLTASGFTNLRIDGEKLFVTTATDMRVELAALLVNHGIGLLQLNQKVNSLEEVFLEWTEEGGL